MYQPTLDGFSCRCSVSPEEAERYGLIGDTFCDPNQGGCYSPKNRPELIQVLADIGGLDFPDLINRIPIPELPANIATIPGDTPLPFPTRDLGPAIATRYTQIGGLRMKRIDHEKVASWRDKRSIPSHRRILLHQEDDDRQLELLFPATLVAGFFEAIRNIGNVVLTSPGYSVYDDHKMCESLQLLNLKRSIHFAYMANRAGQPCIPCIGWNRHRTKDLERISEWLVRQGDKVSHLAVNAQTGGKDLWTILVEGMSSIETQTGRPYRWIVFGGTDVLPIVFSRIDAVRVIHVSATVAVYTQNHRLIGDRKSSDLLPDELLRRNLAIQAARHGAAVSYAESAHRRISVK